jgi:hypothetical protein
MRINRKKELTAVAPDSVISRSGGGAGAQAREGNELKCPSCQPPETSIGRASVWGGKLESPSSDREIYRRL